VSRNYKIHDQEDLHYLTYATVGWVDVFTRPTYKDILVESLRYCQQAKGLELFAWCIMGNHVHLIARAKPGLKLQDILRDHKKFTAKAVLKAIEDNPQESRREWLLGLLHKPDGSIQLWQHDLHPVWLRERTSSNRSCATSIATPWKMAWWKSLTITSTPAREMKPGRRGC